MDSDDEAGLDQQAEGVAAQPHVLIISPNSTVLRLMGHFFPHAGYPNVTRAYGIPAALDALQNGVPDLFVFHWTGTGDLEVPIRFLQQLHERYPDVGIMVVTAWFHVTTASLYEHFGLPVRSVLPLPFGLTDVRRAFEAALGEATTPP